MSLRTTTMAFLAGSVLLGGVPRFAPAQGLRLSTRLNDSLYFEGEPIYLTSEFHNATPDTVWTMRPSFVSGTLQASLDGDRGRVPELMAIADYHVPARGAPGDPLPPGESMYSTIVVLNRWGYPGALDRVLYLRNLPPGNYALTVTFVPLPRVGNVITAAKSQPLHFRVRARSAAEEQMVRSVLELGAAARDPGRRTAFLNRVVAWCRVSLEQDSANAFVPYLLDGGVAMAVGLGLPPAPQVKEDLLNLQVAVARHHSESPAGALLINAEPLRSSPAALSALATHESGRLLDAVIQTRPRRIRRPQ